MIESAFRNNVSLKLFTTLKAGGCAEVFAEAASADALGELAEWAQVRGRPLTVLGWGSNILPSDAGVAGLTINNLASQILVDRNGNVLAETGCAFQDLFLKTAQAGLGGLEYAVGIPGTLGGALISNAGAYRSNVSEFIQELEIVENGSRRWVPKEWMQFSYRDSILRRPEAVGCVVLRVRLTLPSRDPRLIYDEARDYQRQRIGKQPPQASAGSFFKNVYSRELADSLENLPPRLKEAGVVPSGFLIEKVGLKGYLHKGARFSAKHANFIVNVGDASATAIRELAEIGKREVAEAFGVELEEEVLYLGDWSQFNPFFTK